MPLRLVKNPDILVNGIISDLETHLQVLNSKLEKQSLDPADFDAIKDIVEKSMDKIEIKDTDRLPEHLEERTDLKDLLETLSDLDLVIKELIPGRLRFIGQQLDEIKTKNNSEVLRFFDD